jgi:AcrR family transcriptional regulator
MPRGEFDRSERRARTRTQLLEAAARVYAERGIDGATLDDVAEEAGFTKGAVYDHFGSKDNLLFALLDEHLGQEIGEQLALFESNRDTPTRPQIGADLWLAHIQADPASFRLFVEAWVKGQRDPAMRERVVTSVQAWRSMFRTFGEQRGEELGVTKSEALLESHATMMTALGLGFAMLKLTDPEAIPDRLLGAIYLVLVGAFEASPEARALVEDAAAQPVTE